MAATVMAVPRPITKVAATPAQKMPCASAKTSTRIAPEQGRSPTATIAVRPRVQPPGPASLSGVRPMRMAPGNGRRDRWCVVVVMMRVIMVMRVVMVVIVMMMPW